MTTRLGSALIVVLPYLLAIVTGKALLAGALVEPEPGLASSEGESEEPQAATAPTRTSTEASSPVIRVALVARGIA